MINEIIKKSVIVWLAVFFLAPPITASAEQAIGSALIDPVAGGPCLRHIMLCQFKVPNKKPWS